MTANESDAPRWRRRWPRYSLAVALSAWAAATACLSVQTSERPEPSFPHRVHVVDNDLECTFCHGGVYAADAPGLPPPELCAPCHDKIDPDKPADRRVTAFFDAGSRYVRVADSGRPADVRFSHRGHVADQRLDCVRCHAGIADQTAVPLAPLVQKATCMDCHAENGRSNACGECHDAIDERWQPPSHARDWLRGHGTTVRFGSALSADRCELCHEQTAGCTDCHARMAPRNHNQTFRLRTHGLLASADRSRCLTCHHTDSCAQCHQSTRPQSHRGGFGGAQQRHCVSCHLPVEQSSCTLCHQAGAPAHELATPLPANHLPSMNCRLCHGNGQPLPHPDGGHVCTACHK
ncbi:MAG: hypothetical protein KDE27_28695 [Planctomycetes bacterium]|nr:hypothetical protein [Planctomycetota bacterium]